MATTFEVTATALNLRAAPAPTASILTVLRAGQTCIASGSPLDGWLPVTFERFSGFVSQRFVRAIAGNTSPSPMGAEHPTDGDVETKLRDRAQLHPQFRAALDDLLGRTSADGLPFRVFEAFRTPERQEWLYAQGRTRPGGKVTNARAWESFHQFGLAADMVLFIDGRWSWSDAGPLKAHWDRLRELAAKVGLRTLSWEAPHVEWPVPIASAVSPTLIAKGDESWFDNLQLAAQRWKRAGGSGAPVLISDERPPMV